MQFGKGILPAKEYLSNGLFSIQNCYSEAESSFNQQLHFHDFYELSLIYEGSSRFLINGSSFVAAAGSLQPVSYTHLDVYKRQVLFGCGESSGAVSKEEPLTVYLWENSLIKNLVPYIHEQLPDQNIEFIVGNNDTDLYSYMEEHGELPDVITVRRLSLIHI